MTSWHVSIHACDISKFSCKVVSWKGQDVETVNIDTTQLGQPLPVSFDQFIASVNELEGGYAEGDGSFGVCGPGGAWKICGTIYEVNAAMHYVELIGHCPRQALVEFISRLGVKTDRCVLQIMQGGFFVTFQQFWNLEEMGVA